MGHYLSDMLPDPVIVCVNCRKGVYPQSQVDANYGFLETCRCRSPRHARVEDVQVVPYPGGKGFGWTLKPGASYVNGAKNEEL